MRLSMFNTRRFQCLMLFLFIYCMIIHLQLEVLGLLQAFKESADWTLLSLLCHDSDLHMSAFE